MSRSTGRAPRSAPPQRVAAPSERLGRRLQSEHPELSFTRAKRVIEAGQVTVDGEIVQDPGAFVPPTARVVFDAGRPVIERIEAPRIELLHADEDVVVVFKPAGLLTQPTPQREVDTLLSRTGSALARSAGRRPWLAVVHRLDKETSGLVVLATSRRGQAELQRQLEDRSLGRVYLAVVEGELPAAAGTFDQPLVGDGTHRRRWVAAPGESGKPAITHWRTERRLGDATLVRVQLETGRTHQIRIHFAAAGHPVVGDRVYRAPGVRGAPTVSFARQLLHAGELYFQHPADGRPMRFAAPPPPDFTAFVTRLAERDRRRGRPRPR